MDLPALSVLVVSDPNPDADELRSALEAEHCTVVAAASFGDALKYTRSRDLDLIFISSTLQNPDCFAMCGLIKTDLAADEAPVVLLCRDASPELKARAWSAGLDDFLVCPIVREDLLARLTWVVRHRDIRSRLEATRTREAIVLGHIQDAIFVLEADTLRVTEVNPHAAQILNYSQQEILNRPFTDFCDLHGAGLRSAQLLSLKPKQELNAPDVRLLPAPAGVVRAQLNAVGAVMGGRRQVVVTCRDNQTKRELDFAIKRRNRELSSLNTISTIVSRSLELDGSLPELMPRIADAVGSEGVLICLVNRETHDLEPKHSTGRLSALQEQDPQLAVRLCQHVAQTEKPLVVLREACHDPRLDFVDPEKLPLSSYIGVPLMSEEHLFGVLFAVTFEESGRIFEQENADLLTSIGRQLAMAIRNAELYREAERRAVTDALTGLANRGALMTRLEEEIQRAFRYRRDLALIMCDLNRFKQVNDTRGHLVGDLALKKVAQILQASCRASDMVARYGGDEYVVLLPETAAGGAMQVARRIKELTAQAVLQPEGQAPLELSLSLGVAILRPTASTPDELLAAADHALYEAKRGGPNPCLAVAARAQ